ncbi:unnamed protein product [Polarella glacialis]|uniref:Kinesin motor domain-containing protein n=1 Tax=Polarella glacialis TaxID=89957 RepID=A0A813GMN2_POLGL|nr:unnamed protein product [Polarella glacialis]
MADDVREVPKEPEGTSGHHAQSPVDCPSASVVEDSGHSGGGHGPADVPEATTPEDAGSGAAHVIVAVRCRPMSEKELSDGGSPALKINKSQLSLTHKGEEQRYNFDYVLGEEASQAEVFEVLGKPQLDKAFQGYNSTIFAYGQTGSGKTHTMLNVHSEEELGLIPRISRSLFARIADLTRERGTRRFLVQCSFLEIYNEMIYDLLVPRSSTASKGKGLEIREQKGLGVYVKDLTEAVVQDAQQLGQLIAEGFEQRTIAATAMNNASSRSHCVFTIRIHQKDTDSSRNSFISKLNLVDLAGSERAEGVRLKEGANINKSLSALSNVINALSSAATSKRRAFVPYRDSKLTRVLQESLGGNSLCTMIATVSPADVNAEETQFTLNYAKRAKTIRVAAMRNEEASQTKLLEKEVEALRQKMNAEGEEEAHLDDVEARHKAEMEALEAFMRQSWEDKQRLSEQHDEQRKQARLEAQNAAEQVLDEQRRRLQLLEQHGDLSLSLAALTGSGGLQAILADSDLCPNWPERLASVLRNGQQLQSRFRAVRLYRESAGADFSALRGDRAQTSQTEDPTAAELMRLSQAQAKLQIMAQELEALVLCEAEHQEQLCSIAPEVAAALCEARAAQAATRGESSSVSDGTCEILHLVSCQLGQHYASEAYRLQKEAGQLSFRKELRQLAERLAPTGRGPSIVGALGSSAMETSESSPDQFLSELAIAASHMPAEQEPTEPGAIAMPSLLGLSTLAIPDSQLHASSNVDAAKCARLLRSSEPCSGWSPARSAPSRGGDGDGDASESSSAQFSSEFLEVDLCGDGSSLARVVAGISLQGRVPASGRWQQTRGLLQMVLGGPLGGASEEEALQHVQERTFMRPPVRCVYEVALSLVSKCHFDHFKVLHDAVHYDYASVTKEQKADFFTELIRQTNLSWKSADVEALHLEAQDIFSGRRCGETNRMLQLLAYLALGQMTPSSGGLVDAGHQWTKSWRLQYLTEDGRWCWRSAASGNSCQEADAAIFAGNLDAKSVCFVSLRPHFKAVKLRIYPVTWHRHPALRVEVHIASASGELSDRPTAEPGGQRLQGLGAADRLQAELALVLRASAELRQVLEASLRPTPSRHDSLVGERATQELGKLQQQLAEALARAATAEASLLQLKAESDRLQVTSLELTKPLEPSAPSFSASGRDREALHAEELSRLQDLSEQLLVVSDERDVARAHEEELFDVISSKDEELLQARKSCADLTERLEEKELEHEASELLADEMGQLSQQLQDMQSAHADVAAHCQQLEEENRALRAEKDRLVRKKEKLATQKLELVSKLEISENARQAARTKITERMLEKRGSFKSREADGAADPEDTTEAEAKSDNLSGRSHQASSHRSRSTGVASPVPAVAAGGGVAAIEALKDSFSSPGASEAWSSRSHDFGGPPPEVSGRRKSSGPVGALSFGNSPGESAPFNSNPRGPSSKQATHVGASSAALPVFGLPCGNEDSGALDGKSAPNSGRSSRSMPLAGLPAFGIGGGNGSSKLPKQGGRGGAEGETSDAMPRVASAPLLRPASATREKKVKG